MKNKYLVLLVLGVLCFSVIWVINNFFVSDETKTEESYVLKIIDNEIRYNGDVLYKFIPVQGGEMEFKYMSQETRSDALTGKKDTVNKYNSQRLEINSMLIGETPVTINLWVFVMENKVAAENSLYKYETVYVSDKTKEEWSEFLSKLEQLTGREFRLPTNYEWEYAARGGQKSKNYKYAGSNNIDEVAHYKGNTSSERSLLGKEKAPNELGLYDMSGGVKELTSTSLSEIDPFLRMFNEKEFNENYISRGGDYKSTAEECETRYVSSGYSVGTGARLILDN